MDRILKEHERRGSSKWKKSCEERQGLLLFDSETQSSSARAICVALNNHFNSLLHAISTVSLHHF